MGERVVVFGGSGFVGSYVVKKLAESGHSIKVVVRNPESASHLRLCGNVGQVSVVKIGQHDLMSDATVVINLIGIMYETYKGEFYHVHVEMARMIAAQAKLHSAEKLIHFSALANENSSEYTASKIAGEQAVLEQFPQAVIIRPSLIFGREDKFFNKFAKLAATIHLLPLIGEGREIFQPVYVCDIAALIELIVSNVVVGQVYNVGGPKTYSLKSLLKFILNVTKRRCLLINIPFSLAKMLAWILECRIVAVLLKPISGGMEPLLTVDQVKMMWGKNLQQCFDLEEAGIRATHVENLVPTYLHIYK